MINITCPTIRITFDKFNKKHFRAFHSPKILHFSRIGFAFRKIGNRPKWQNSEHSRPCTPNKLGFLRLGNKADQKKRTVVVSRKSLVGIGISMYVLAEMSKNETHGWLISHIRPQKQVVT